MNITEEIHQHRKLHSRHRRCRGGGQSVVDSTGGEGGWWLINESFSCHIGLCDVLLWSEVMSGRTQAMWSRGTAQPAAIVTFKLHSMWWWQHWLAESWLFLNSLKVQCVVFTPIQWSNLILHSNEFMLSSTSRFQTTASGISQDSRSYDNMSSNCFGWWFTLFQTN